MMRRTRADRTSLGRRASAAAVIAAIACSAGAAPAAAQTQERSAELFTASANRVVKLEVIESGSGAKASLGTGFFVSRDGHLVTNYHVVADVIREPERYRAQWVRPGQSPGGARLLAIDVVADLAVLATDTPAPEFFQLGEVRVPRGARLYSLGHPQDLGLSIVEGTYNGLLEHALYPKIHFTGPLNEGMSGGPALTAEGSVIGINVATGGNSLSFLVPAERALRLLDRARRQPDAEPGGFLELAGRQVLEHQERYLGRLFAEGARPLTLGPFEVPTEPAEFFRCWGNAERDPDALAERVVHRCSTDDYLYLTAGQSSGIVSVEHELLTSRGLDPVRFYSMYRAHFAGAGLDYAESGQDVTAARCHTDNIRQRQLVMRAVFCLRAYLDFPELYDATIRAAVLGARDVGLVTTLSLSGVSVANAERIAREYLGRIRWAGR